MLQMERKRRIIVLPKQLLGSMSLYPKKPLLHCQLKWHSGKLSNAPILVSHLGSFLETVIQAWQRRFRLRLSRGELQTLVQMMETTARTNSHRPCSNSKSISNSSSIGNSRARRIAPEGVSHSFMARGSLKGRWKAYWSMKEVTLAGTGEENRCLLTQLHLLTLSQLPFLFVCTYVLISTNIHAKHT